MCVCDIHIERKWWPYLAWHLFLPSHLFVLSCFLQGRSPPLSSSSISLLHFAASPEKALLYYLTGHSIRTAAPSKPVHFCTLKREKALFCYSWQNLYQTRPPLPPYTLLCSALLSIPNHRLLATIRFLFGKPSSLISLHVPVVSGVSQTEIRTITDQTENGICQRLTLHFWLCFVCFMRVCVCACCCTLHSTHFNTFTPFIFTSHSHH